jgi:cyclophilin family peptidyl-prolyl cis-trans isomerase
VLKPLSALLAVLALALAAGCGEDDSESDSGGGSADTATETTAEQPAQAGECEQVDQPAPREDGGATKPKEKLDPGTRYEVTMETNCGSFTFALDQKAAPNTAASVAKLVEDGFYDGTVFHRIVPGFVIQGGDPTASGTGGAGYTTRDVPPSNAAYTKGVVAMAKAGNEPPGAASSQFYVVTGADAGLPPDYAIIGEVTDGLDVVDRIGRLGNPATEQPVQVVVVEKATLSEG